ncbi:MAG: 50S ribosomal protein L11 methyltransferase, partial [Candidatus Binatia bacterium]
PGVVLTRNEVRAFFARSPRSSALKREIHRFLRDIRKIYPGFAEHPLGWKLLKEKNWAKSWRRFFSPHKVGRSLLITPPWVDPPATRRRQIIIIEPGMAFGTGTHATTRCCLEFLEHLASRFNGGELTALDVGTGSGILAIALAKLGAASVVALDNDPTALKVARANVRVNGVERRIRLANWKLDKVYGSFAVVVANLTAETIVDLAAPLEERVAGDGYLVLSGILQPKARQVVRRFCPSTFIPLRQSREKEWVTLLLQKKS